MSRFRPILFALFALLAALAWPMAAEASGDGGCYPSLKLAHRTLTGCDDIAALSPGNDTRVNLLLLLRDRHGAVAPPGGQAAALFEWRDLRGAEPAAHARFAVGEGSRCRSDASGAAAFEAAVRAARMPDGDRVALVDARRALKPGCDEPGAAPTAAVGSKVGRAFATYLEGAGAFYGGNFDAASARFGALARADDPWLRETARYMLARVEVNRAQVDAFDEWGSLRDAPVDRRLTTLAEAALGDYLAGYPRGRYATSARGLVRRVHWLAGDTARLAADYAALLSRPEAARGIDDVALAEEIDHKLLPRLRPGDTRDPVLLAVLHLATMRGSEGGDPARVGPLEGDRAAFARDPDLFGSLVAARAVFVADRPGDVLRLVPDVARGGAFGPVRFSRQVLRGLALEATGDGRARAFWLTLLPGAADPRQRALVELAIARHDERAGAVGRVFAPGSPVRTPLFRETLLATVADAALLRAQATAADAPRHERDLALFTLLYKEVSRGRYRDFVADLKLVPSDAAADSPVYLEAERIPVGLFARGDRLGDVGCPALPATAAALAADARAVRPRLCLAEFVRVNGLDGFGLDNRPPPDELGGTPSLFPGPPYSRLEVYRAIIAARGVAPEDRAYALFRAVNCYAPSGTNACGGAGVNIAQRRAWFAMLKRDHPASPWTQSLRYYW